MLFAYCDVNHPDLDPSMCFVKTIIIFQYACKHNVNFPVILEWRKQFSKALQNLRLLKFDT